MMTAIVGSVLGAMVALDVAFRVGLVFVAMAVIGAGLGFCIDRITGASNDA